jgi:hypothetical protein
LKENNRQVFYQCNACKAKREVLINLTYYNDHHVCEEGHFHPLVLAIDRKYQVRSQSRVMAKKKKTIAIPMPSVKLDNKELLYRRDIIKRFKFIKLINNVSTATFFAGEKDNIQEIIKLNGDNFLFGVEYQLYNENQSDRIKKLVVQMLNALNQGRTYDLNALSSLVVFLITAIGLDEEYPTSQIMHEITFSSTRYLQWVNASVGEEIVSYKDVLPEELYSHILKVLEHFEFGKLSIEEISEKTELDLNIITQMANKLVEIGFLKVIYQE